MKLERESMKKIIVYNPAAQSGGALTILEELIKKIQTINCKNKFYFIVSLQNLKKYETQNLKIIVIKRQSFLKKIFWDNYFLEKFLEKKIGDFEKIISLQNIALKLNSKKFQILYYHQALSISSFKWNILKKEQRTYWFYQNIYPIFIKINLKKVRVIIVQANWIKDAFSKKFKFDKSKIIVLKPNLVKPLIEKKDQDDKIIIFYPADCMIYKNHIVIIEALKELKNEGISLKNVKCIFTFSKGSNKFLDSEIIKNQLDEQILLIGKIDYDEVINYYKKATVLVFPSYLETVGLPLIEAQWFELPIIASKLPYVEEATEGYLNVIKSEMLKDDLKKYLKERIKNDCCL